MIESASITDRQLATSCCWNNKQNVRRLGTNRSCRWQMLQNWAKKNKETAVIFFLETGAIFYGIHPDVAYVWAQICELIKDKYPIRFDKIRSQSTSGTFSTWHRFFISLFFHSNWRFVFRISSSSFQISGNCRSIYSIFVCRCIQKLEARNSRSIPTFEFNTSARRLSLPALSKLGRFSRVKHRTAIDFKQIIRRVFEKKKRRPWRILTPKTTLVTCSRGSDWTYKDGVERIALWTYSTVLNLYWIPSFIGQISKIIQLLVL